MTPYLLFGITIVLSYICGSRQLFLRDKKGGLDLVFKGYMKKYHGKFTIRGLVEIRDGEKVIAKTNLKRTEIPKT